MKQEYTQRPVTTRGILYKNLPELAGLYFDIVLQKPNAKSALMTESSRTRIIDSFEKVMAKLPVDDPLQITGLSDGSISGRVDAVMQAVATGQIDIDQGKRLIEMLQAGFEITELKDLIAKLSSAGVELE